MTAHEVRVIGKMGPAFDGIELVAVGRHASAPMAVQFSGQAGRTGNHGDTLALGMLVEDAARAFGEHF